MKQETKAQPFGAWNLKDKTRAGGKFNNQFHLFRRGPASEGQTVDGLLNELNGRRIVMTEEQFENWMNEEI